MRCSFHDFSESGEIVGAVRGGNPQDRRESDAKTRQAKAESSRDQGGRFCKVLGEAPHPVVEVGPDCLR
jgi:hypothetical protein